MKVGGLRVIARRPQSDPSRPQRPRFLGRKAVARNRRTTAASRQKLAVQWSLGAARNRTFTDGEGWASARGLKPTLLACWVGLVCGRYFTGIIRCS